MELAGAVVGALTQHTINVVENEVSYSVIDEATLHSYAFDCGSQLKHLVQTLEHINGLLHDKVNLKLNAGQVKPAMIPLRQLIYEADDVITDCVVKGEYAGRLTGCDFLFLWETGKKLKDINSRLNKQLETLKKFLDLKQGLEASAGADKNNSDKKELMSQDFNPNEVIGLDKDVKTIRGWILEPGKFHRVAVWGMGGLGKTTLVQEIFNDPEVTESFDNRIWVPVSKSFDKHRILTTVLKKLGGKIPDDDSQLLREVGNAVAKQTKGCLVVMDDVWKIEGLPWWNDLLKALEVKGQTSCVIVTTRDKEVASIAVRGDESRSHEARKLNEADSWKLFCQFAIPTPEFEPEGKKIVAKCGGLPLSIKAIGSLLAAKTKLSEWTDVLDYFHGNSAIEGNEQVIENLRLSYTELDAHLKQCLLCFSAYPEDSDISADQLIHWWLAEGLLEKRGSKRSALELGREYLSGLINRCLVEVGRCRPFDGRVYSCKVHDMVRDLIMTIAQEEGFCSFNEQGIPIWNKDSYWLCLNANLMKEKEATTKRVKGKIVVDSDKCLSFEKDSKLRAVLLMPDHQVNINKRSGKLSSLRMLDLSSGSGNYLDPKQLQNLLDWIGDLTRLACLNLSGFESLEELPSSIYKLRNLQLLVLSGCTNLKRLDSSIAKLRRLIVLHLDNCTRLKHLPRDLEKLYKLQELSGFAVTIGGKKDKEACGLAELANLTELRVLHIVISSDDEADLSQITGEWNNILSGLKNLRTLGIDAKNFRNGLHILDCLCPPETLRELYLRNYRRKKLPDWIKPSRLRKLQYLCIEDAEKVDEWKHQGEEWEVLEGLRLKDLKKLKADWDELKKGMSRLSYLEVIKCDNLENLPKEMKNGIWRKRST